MTVAIQHVLKGGRAEIRVRCSGHIHRVLMVDGALAFPDHRPGDFATEKALIALGSKPCRCYELLQLWRARIRGGVMQSLADAAKQRMRWVCDSGGDGDRLSMPLEDRLHRRILDMASWALEQTHYRRSKSRWAGGQHRLRVFISSTGESFVRGYAEKTWSMNGKWSGTNSIIEVGILLKWYRVWKLCQGVIDGIFILDILEQVSDSEYRVLAGRQGPGFQVYAWPARALLKEGAWCLKWEKERGVHDTAA